MSVNLRDVLRLLELLENCMREEGLEHEDTLEVRLLCEDVRLYLIRGPEILEEVTT